MYSIAINGNINMIFFPFSKILFSKTVINPEKNLKHFISIFSTNLLTAWFLPWERMSYGYSVTFGTETPESLENPKTFKSWHCKFLEFLQLKQYIKTTQFQKSILNEDKVEFYILGLFVDIFVLSLWSF